MKKAIAIIALLILAIAGYKLWPHSSTTLPKILFGTTGGPNFPTSASSTTCPPDGSWSNPTAIEANDGVPAIGTTVASGCGETGNLLGTAYGFSIPAGATVNGITVAMARRSGANTNIEDVTMRLLKAGVATGNNKALLSNWTTSTTTITYGSSSDLWGTTWGSSDINDTNFGVVFNGTNTSSGTANAYVDYITITVDYTASGQHVTVTHTAGTLTITQGTVVIP